MDLKEVALQLWPCWMMGIMMVYLTLKSEYKNLLRVEKKAVFNWVKILAMVCFWRFLLFKFAASDGMIQQARSMAHLIPLPAIFGVFWEDACFSMPLVLASLMFQKSKLYSWLSKPLLVLVMLAFACGHIYQGLFPALAISLYIPVAMKMGKKYGYGTVMISHMLYDMSTLLSIRWMLG